MNDDEPEPTGAILERVAQVLRSHQVLDFAFTGGVAVGVWAAPRQTKDVDLCGSGERVYCSDRELDHAFVRDAQLRAADLVPFLRRMRRLKLEAIAR